MDIKNSQRLTAYDLAKGKVNSERVFQHAMAKSQMPQRSAGQEGRAKGEGVVSSEWYRSEGRKAGK